MENVAPSENQLRDDGAVAALARVKPSEEEEDVRGEEDDHVEDKDVEDEDEDEEEDEEEEEEEEDGEEEKREAAGKPEEDLADKEEQEETDVEEDQAALEDEEEEQLEQQEEECCSDEEEEQEEQEEEEEEEEQEQEEDHLDAARFVQLTEDGTLAQHALECSDEAFARRLQAEFAEEILVANGLSGHPTEFEGHPVEFDPPSRAAAKLDSPAAAAPLADAGDEELARRLQADLDCEVVRERRVPRGLPKKNRSTVSQDSIIARCLQEEYVAAAQQQARAASSSAESPSPKRAATPKAPLLSAPLNLLTKAVCDLHPHEVWNARRERYRCTGVKCTEVDSAGQCKQRNLKMEGINLLFAGQDAWSLNVSELVAIYPSAASAEFDKLAAQQSKRRFSLRRPKAGPKRPETCCVLVILGRRFAASHSIYFQKAAERNEFIETLAWHTQACMQTRMREHGESGQQRRARDPELWRQCGFRLDFLQRPQ